MKHEETYFCLCCSVSVLRSLFLCSEK